MAGLFPEEIRQKLGSIGVIAVLTLHDSEDAVPVAESLLAGGICGVEVALRTPVALDALSAISRRCPDMLVAAGTVLATDQIQQVIDAGGAFAVSPGLNAHIVERAVEMNLPFAPGIATPSELEEAIGLGCREVKFFPAQPIGGLGYLKSMAAPYNHLDIRYLPLGGVNIDNVRDYLECPLVMAVGGSWLVSQKDIDDKNWAKITERAKFASSLVRDIRGDG